MYIFISECAHVIVFWTRLYNMKFLFVFTASEENNKMNFHHILEMF